MKKYASVYVFWLLLFVIAPIGLIVLYSLSGVKDPNFSDFQWSLVQYKRVFSPIYLKILWRSIVLSGVSTFVCLLVGYPVAYAISMASARRQKFLILFFIVPMWMNFLLRTYAWLTLLGNHGLINRAFQLIGLGPFDLMYNDLAILLGMIYNFLPFMVLPIYSILAKIDESLIEAARDLGANGVTVFTRVVFPLTLPGVMTGVSMVFIPAISTFVISALLGGNKYYLIGNLIEQQFRFTGNWPFGAALSVLLIAIMLFMLWLGRCFDRNGVEKGGVVF